MASAHVGDTTRKPLGWKKLVGYVISVVIVVAIFTWAIPRFADYSDVWAAIKTLTPIEAWSLVAATIFNLVTYWWANQAALPGLGIGKAAVLTQTTTSVANTLPAGGAIAVGLTYSILNSWGFTGTSVALYVGVTGIWNIFTKLALPMLALVLLALSGPLTGTYIVAAILGVIVLGLAVGLFALLFRSEEFAIRIGNWLGGVVSWFRRLFRKPAVTTWGEGAARFRRDTVALMEHRWIRLTLTTVLSQVALFLVFLLSLRASASPSRRCPPPKRSPSTRSRAACRRSPPPLVGWASSISGISEDSPRSAAGRRRRSLQRSCCSGPSPTGSRYRSAGSRTSSGGSSRTGAVKPTRRRSASGPATSRPKRRWSRFSTSLHRARDSTSFPRRRRSPSRRPS